MKLFNLLLLVFGMAIITSCSSDDDCIAADWVGTYVLDASTEDCSSESISLSTEVVITAGFESNSINFDGIEAQVNGCNLTVTEPYFGLTANAKLDGDKIKVDGFGCTGTYIRQ
jgi:hypothetical protein